ncbi:cupin domain-containing protein [Congregibacter variabilis]|uniref:Cupin domain-containing protein n=1 Tax=Congregibacter variabilis TaxID=3081200 RepID=A0ABZ0I4E7_9GAMM|nr:cupin domain-containing protein [Congregibacter sp. IMCC43200]
MHVTLGKTIFVILSSLVAATVHSADTEPDFSVVQSSELTWQAVPGGLGTQFAVVRGDPSKAGVYVIRVRFPAGVMDAPHFHSADRHVTVIEGSWYAGVGTTFNPEKAQEIRAGGYMFHPAGAAHWDGAKGSNDAVVQIIGNGPVATEQSSDEPMWLRVHE